MNCRKLALGTLVAAASLLLSGCATHTANDKSHTIILGGLYEREEGAYEKQGPHTLPINIDKPLPGSPLNGDKVSFLWGLISYHNQ